MIGIDADLVRIVGGHYDLQLCNGDIKTVDSFDAALVTSLYTDRRASPSESPIAHRRRGWIGNESTPNFEIGSKLWLYTQARLTRTTLNGIESAFGNALRWLIDEGYAVEIKSVVATVTGTSKVTVEVVLLRPGGLVERRFYDLWDKTGVSIPCDNSSDYILNQLVTRLNYNIFHEAGGPEDKVSVIVNVNALIGSSDVLVPGFSTGTGWHPETTLTLNLMSAAAVLSGKGGDGQMGSSGTHPDADPGEQLAFRSGDGGAGHNIGLHGQNFGSASFDAQSEDGTLDLGGSTGAFAATESGLFGTNASTKFPERGGIAIELFHPLTINNLNGGKIQNGGNGGLAWDSDLQSGSGCNAYGYIWGDDPQMQRSIASIDAPGGCELLPISTPGYRPSIYVLSHNQDSPAIKTNNQNLTFIGGLQGTILGEIE